MQNLISVIVCTYNQEKTIGRTLDSILSQRCHVPFEIVIGEDCSSDATLNVCMHYAEKYPGVIRVIANSQNKGLVDNFFDCIFAAKGKYISCCAGDDFWCDDVKLEKEIAILEQNPNVGIVHTEWKSFNEKTGETTTPIKSFHKEAFIDGKKLLEDILTQTQRPVIHPCTALFRTDWLRQSHDEYREFFRNKKYLMEDIQIFFFLSRMGSVAYLPDVTLSYSQGGETISHSNNEVKQAFFVRSAAQLTYDLAQRFDLMTPKVKTFLQMKVFEMLMHAFRANNKELRHSTLLWANQHNVKPDAKIIIIKSLTSCQLLWRTTLVLRKIFVLIKRYKNA